MKMYKASLVFASLAITPFTFAQEIQWATSVAANQTGSSFGLANCTTPSGDAVFNVGSFNETVYLNPGSSDPGFVNSANFAFYITKHTSGGQFSWGKVFTGGSMYQISVASDDAGNAYAYGSFFGSFDADPGSGTHMISATGNNISRFLIKLDAAGNFVWAQQLGDNMQNNDNVAIAIKGDAIYCTGQYSGQCDFDNGPGQFLLTAQDVCDIFLVKLNTDGVFQWAASLGSANNTPNEQEWGTGLAIAPDNSVYLTGGLTVAGDFNPGPGTTILDPQQERDMFIAKFNAAGTFQWVLQCNELMAPASVSIAAGPDNSAYITGTSENNNEAIFVSRYSAQGTQLWARHFGGTADDHGNGIDVDENGYVYVSGYLSSNEVDFDPGSGQAIVFNATEYPDAFFLRLTADGAFSSIADIGPGGGNSTRVTSLDYNNGAIYVNGYFTGLVDFDMTINGSTDIPCMGLANAFMAKYDTTGIHVAGIDELNEIPFQLFPNPANNTVVLTSDFMPVSEATLFNLAGQPVLHQQLTQLSQEIDLSALPAGTYLVEVSNGYSRSTQKLVKK